MWTVVGDPVEPGQFEPFEPFEVLETHDGAPVVFTFMAGGVRLAIWSDADETHTRYLVAHLEPCGPVDLRTLGEESVHVVDVEDGGRPVQAWAVKYDDIPVDAKPQSTGINTLYHGQRMSSGE